MLFARRNSELKRSSKEENQQCIFDTLRIRQVDISSCYNNAARVPQLLRVDKFNEGSIRSWRGACSISHIRQWANQQSVFRTMVRGDWLRRLLQRTVDCQSNCLNVLMIGWNACLVTSPLHHLSGSNIIGLSWCNVSSDWSVERAEK